MDDLEVNPLFKAFLTKFRKEFDLARKMSYLIAIPHSDSIENAIIDQFLANSHILMPSRLLKMHFNSLQMGHSSEIERVDDRKLIVHLDRKNKIRLKVNILAEDIGYNGKNEEFRTILVDRPLIAVQERISPFTSFLSPRLPMLSFSSSPSPLDRLREKQLFKPLTNHDSCFKYLECLSQEVTEELDLEVRKLQSNYIILSHYLDDAAERIKLLVDEYVSRYEDSYTDKNNHDYVICCSERIRDDIRLSVENYVIHSFHGKLSDSLYKRYKEKDEILLKKFEEIHRSKLTICQLGAQSSFAYFHLSEEIEVGLRKLSSLQSPLAIVNQLLTLVGLINDSLNQSVRFIQLMGLEECDGKKTTICSDDLIASMLYSLARVKPPHLYSLSKYLETFGWTSCDKDQAAYYTATFQIVIQYAINHVTPAATDDLDHIVGNNEESITSCNNVASSLPQRRSKDRNGFNKNLFIDSLDSRGSTIGDMSDATDDPSSMKADEDWELVAM